MGRKFSSRASRNFVRTNKYSISKAYTEQAKFIKTGEKIEKQYQELQDYMKNSSDEIQTMIKDAGMDSKMSIHNKILEDLENAKKRDNISEKQINHINKLIKEHNETLSLEYLKNIAINEEDLDDNKLNEYLVKVQDHIKLFNEKTENEKLILNNFSDDFITKLINKFDNDENKNICKKFILKLFNMNISTNFNDDYKVSTTNNNVIFVANSENMEDEFVKAILNNILQF